MRTASFGSRVLLATFFCAGSIAAPRSQTDPVAALSGTWGLPPVDAQPGLSGSIFTAYRDDRGIARLDLIFAPSGWSCSIANQEVTWNDAERRFEWPNRSLRTPGGACWVRSERRGDALDVRVYCPYECTGAADVKTITLSRMAASRLEAPADVVSTFCASPDPLRHQMCTRGSTYDGIADGVRLARQLDVLSDTQTSTEPETEQVLIDILSRCRTQEAGASCVEQQVRARADRLRPVVASRQRALADERQASEARTITLAGTALPAGWEAGLHLVNDQAVAALTLDECDRRSCAAEISSETNYTFGMGRQGTCTISARMQFTGPEDAFGYVEVAADDRNEYDAGPFANFCRVDLHRNAAGTQVGVRGSGCELWCSEARVEGLLGTYRRPGAPSFACRDVDALEWDEKIVCLDPDLAGLDRELATAFTTARKAAAPKAAEALTASQRQWRRERHDTCDTERRYSCVKEIYQRRIAELRR